MKNYKVKKSNKINKSVKNSKSKKNKWYKNKWYKKKTKKSSLKKGGWGSPKTRDIVRNKWRISK